MGYCCRVLVLSFLGELSREGFYICVVISSRMVCDLRITVVQHMWVPSAPCNSARTCIKDSSIPEGVIFKDQGLWERKKKMPAFYHISPSVSTTGGWFEEALVCVCKPGFPQRAGSRLCWCRGWSRLLPAQKERRTTSRGSIGGIPAPRQQLFQQLEVRNFIWEEGCSICGQN